MNDKHQIFPGTLISLIPLLLLIVLLTTNVIIFKDGAVEGPNQLGLLFCSVVVVFIGRVYLKCSYRSMEQSMVKAIGRSMQAVVILLTVGVLISLWIMSGIVPTMIYYGLKVLHPSFFLPVSCLICCVVSLSTGSSWSTAGTVGVALIAIGTTLGLPAGLVAGAVISGAYFGDKMSPLSDTTNLAPAAAGTDLFTHIRHMVYTTTPAITLAIIAFALIGALYDAKLASTETIDNVLYSLESTFHLGIHLFIVPVLVIAMVAKKMPALPALVIGVLLGAICVVCFQPQFISGEGNYWLNAYKEVMKVASTGFVPKTQNEMVNELLRRGGMQSMLNTVWLIIAAMVFGGVLEGTRMLERLAQDILKRAKGTSGLIGSTLGSCVVLNATASDQYLAIIVPGRMFQSAYRKLGLHPKNLSRALEDAGTVTSVLVPWNSGGAYISTVLGVATLSYLPFCFFNILSPIISFIYALTGFTIEKVKQS